MAAANSSGSVMRATLGLNIGLSVPGVSAMGLIGVCAAVGLCCCPASSALETRMGATVAITDVEIAQIWSIEVDQLNSRVDQSLHSQDEQHSQGLLGPARGQTMPGKPSPRKVESYGLDMKL